MKISDIFRQDAVKPGSSRETARQAPAEQAQAAQLETRRKGEDSVSISPLYHQLNQVSKILSEDESARAQRVAELKSKVEAGTYSVSSTDVARSMIAYAADGEIEGA